MRHHHLARFDIPVSNDAYTYPEHLHETALAAPHAPGVYIFRGKGNGYPLYIGKSINLRARLMSHLRSKEEKRLLIQAGTIETIQTAGELSALLLEAQLIKAMQPTFNKLLRTTNDLHSIRIDGQNIRIETVKNLHPEKDGNLYGLFKNRKSAIGILHSLADRHGLCLAVMGLDTVIKSRGCFRHAIKKCHGACCGNEPIDAHHERLRQALCNYRVATWPYEGFVGIQEQYEDLSSIHVIRNWHYYGTVEKIENLKQLKVTSAPLLDADIYKILVSAIFKSGTRIVTFSASDNELEDMVRIEGLEPPRSPART